jgi:hypothetical protein
MSGEHQIYEVEAWELTSAGRKYFSVYYRDGRNGLKYVFPNIAARDELEAFTIAMKKLEEGAD